MLFPEWKKFVQENLFHLAENSKSVWHLSHDLLPCPPSYPQGPTLWEFYTGRVYPRRQGFLLSLASSLGPQFPLRKGRLPEFLISSPSVPCFRALSLSHLAPTLSVRHLPQVWQLINTGTESLLPHLLLEQRFHYRRDSERQAVRTKRSAARLEKPDYIWNKEWRTPCLWTLLSPWRSWQRGIKRKLALPWYKQNVGKSRNLIEEPGRHS